MEKLYEFIESLIDRDARLVFQALFEENRELEEEELAEKTGLKLTSVRRALNALLERGFVVYRRIRSIEKNKVVFRWRINAEGLHSLILSRKKAVVNLLKAKLDFEESTFYYTCPLDGSRYTLDEAMEYNFSCPRCGSMLEPEEDKDLRVQVLREYIRRLEEEIRAESSAWGG